MLVVVFLWFNSISNFNSILLIFFSPEYQRQLWDDIDLNGPTDGLEGHMHVWGDKFGVIFVDTRGPRSFGYTPEDAGMYIGTKQFKAIQQVKLVIGWGGGGRRWWRWLICDRAINCWFWVGRIESTRASMYYIDDWEYFAARPLLTMVRSPKWKPWWWYIPCPHSTWVPVFQNVSLVCRAWPIRFVTIISRGVQMLMVCSELRWRADGLEWFIDCCANRWDSVWILRNKIATSRCYTIGRHLEIEMWWSWQAICITALELMCLTRKVKWSCDKSSPRPLTISLHPLLQLVSWIGAACGIAAIQRELSLRFDTSRKSMSSMWVNWFWGFIPIKRPRSWNVSWPCTLNDVMDVFALIMLLIFTVLNQRLELFGNINKNPREKQTNKQTKNTISVELYFDFEICIDSIISLVNTYHQRKGISFTKENSPINKT